MIEGYIDTVSTMGLVFGWARARDRAEPVRLELWLEGVSVGKAVAAVFRRDLLAAKVGHGHYGFNCKIRPRDRFHGTLELRDADAGGLLTKFVLEPGRLVLGARMQRQSVESFLKRADCWSLEDVAEHVEALDLEQRLFELGARTYVAMVYRFLLHRWPAGEEHGFYLQDLTRGTISATEVFRAVLEGTECKAGKFVPVSPFDPKFPFGIKPRDAVGKAAQT